MKISLPLRANDTLQSGAAGVDFFCGGGLGFGRGRTASRAAPWPRTGTEPARWPAYGKCRGPIAPDVRWAGAVAGGTPSAHWMDSMGLAKAASPAAFLAGGAWPSPEPLPPCQPSSGWLLLILDVVCRQRGLQPAPLLGPQREVSGCACRSRSTHGRPRSEAAAWDTGAPSSGTMWRRARAWARDCRKSKATTMPYLNSERSEELGLRQVIQDDLPFS